MQRKTIWRAAAATVTVGTLVAVVAFFPTTSGAAPGDPVNSSAFGLSVGLLNGGVAIGPLGPSACLPGGTNTAVGATVGALGAVGVSTGTTSCDPVAGTSSATGTVANVALNVALGPIGFAATTVSATCSATSTGPPTGSTTLVGATLNGVAIANLTPTKNFALVNTAILSIVLNEQVPAVPGTGGVLTVNAVHIKISALGLVGHRHHPWQCYLGPEHSGFGW